jgi:hypothetical protein
MKYLKPNLEILLNQGLSTKEWGSDYKLFKYVWKKCINKIYKLFYIIYIKWVNLIIIWFFSLIIYTFKYISMKKIFLLYDYSS